ncbi:uncharacterized protein LOC143910818 [Arctopsyche grandis]|uniref:uncharacterized protein LOC143910818 n=1 Tax=Arctopsyche grandis TaxID=121162 RepID=UPI00406D753C
MLGSGTEVGRIKGRSCTFPSKWSGRWFQSGVTQQIVIEGDRLSSKGKCLSSEGDKFLLVDEKKCYKCVVIHEKHINVLQYKETFCHTREALPNLCSLITGDALLYSMFRENASPVSCPLRGPFSFTYNRGHGECRNPVSSIESCTEESRLLWNFQACPDVYGSESTVEELECLATWKEGSQRYLVGRVHHNHAMSNEDRYRCFVYEKTNGINSHALVQDDDIEYNIAQSGDATCNGLSSATEGSRTMALKRVPSSWKCRFPSWMTFPGHWHTLDYSSTYSFHQKNNTLRITSSVGEFKVHCAHIRSSSITDTSVALVAHWQRHCVGVFICVAFYRRSAHVTEMQTGRGTNRAEDACSPANFNPSVLHYVTLVTSNPEAKDCPYSGKFTIAGLKIHQRNARSLEVPSIKNESVKNHHKHYNKKHKHSIRNDEDELLVTIERRKRKYQKFLEKIFAKETLKRERLQQKMSSKSNTTVSSQNITKHENTTFSNITKLAESQSRNYRNRRSSSNVDTSTCINSEFSTLDIGCNTHENMEFHSSCDNKEFITAYSCHGGWTDNGTSFLITTPLTRDSIGAKRYCFIYKESNDRTIHFTRTSENCDRNLWPGVDGALVFNVTSSGECVETSSAVVIGSGRPTLINYDSATLSDRMYCILAWTGSTVWRFNSSFKALLTKKIHGSVSG